MQINVFCYLKVHNCCLAEAAIYCRATAWPAGDACFTCMLSDYYYASLATLSPSEPSVTTSNTLGVELLNITLLNCTVAIR